MDLYRVNSTMTGTYINGSCTFRHYFDLAGGSAANAASAVLAFWTSLATLMNGTTNITVSGIVEQMDSENGTISNAYSVTPGSASSGSAADALPWATSLLLQWRTGAYYSSGPGKGARELRGRLYLPMMKEADSTLGKPISSLTTPAAAAAAALVSHATSSFGIWRRPVRDSAGTLTRNGEFAPAISGTCWDNWAQMRSRRD